MWDYDERYDLDVSVLYKKDNPEKYKGCFKPIITPLKGTLVVNQKYILTHTSKFV